MKQMHQPEAKMTVITRAPVWHSREGFLVTQGLVVRSCSGKGRICD